VDSFGHVTVDSSDSENIKAKTIIKINWIDGSFELVDDCGTTFSMDKAGSCQAVPYEPPSESLENSSINELITYSKATKNPHKGNHPRFFILHENGSGAELLRDEDVNKFLKLKAKDSSTVLSEEVMEESQGKSLLVVSPLQAGGKVPNAFCYRQVFH
jgi:hypothetical protein